MYGTTDVLPLWIADMDFATPEPIMSTLRSLVVSPQPVQGYKPRIIHNGKNLLFIGMRNSMMPISRHTGYILFPVL